jgi:polyisoprenoid-binding protein YceI
MKSTIAALIMTVGLMSTNAQAPKTSWNLDQAHSSVKFSIDHLVISETEGAFKTFSTDIKSDKPDFTDVAGTITIDVKSIDTDNNNRDEHLRSTDFFDVASYPNITFQITKFTKVSGKQYKVSGNMTMHGVTKPVTLDAKFSGIIKDPYGLNRVGITVTGELDRYAFGLKYNAALEAGGLTIGQEVRIKVNLELTQAK